ncbi:expressed unknown protein [Seminavis robusta]|uniref:Uncharacterized protein n=1 Tax=Seminavis robusta TaxID=568900 RepID=A0A9N8EG37_9STRA|nr:expressed unknown protein [Seminavis robusta]|eukprot:Sro1137_g245320.1 n/a (237) ;mRNA; f:22770-23480
MQASEGMASVAARIQERSLQLSSEQAVLELVQLEHGEYQAALDAENQQTREVRRKFLETASNRNGVELELWNVESKRQDCVESTKRQEEEEERLCAARNEKQAEWEELVEDVLAGHALAQETYRTTFHNISRLRSDAVSKRKQQLAALDDHLKGLNRHDDPLAAEKERLQKALEELEANEQKEDGELARLAQEVQEHVATRSKLRESVRAHQKAYRDANATALLWEKECCDMDAVP